MHITKTTGKTANQGAITSFSTKKNSFEFEPRAPYSFDLQWRFYSSEEPQAETYKNGIWRRAFKLGNRLIPVAVTSVGTLEKPKLKINVSSKLGAKEKRMISEKISNIFGLKDDLGKLYEFMDREPVLRKVKNKLHGLRPPKIGVDMFEGIVRIIIQQQISLQVAYAMTGALVKRFGKKVEVNGESYYDFPSPEVLADARESELRKCKLSRQKARYIRGFASAITGGYDLKKIEKMEDEEAIEELTKFKGIGRWSAELILISTLKRMNLCVPDDLGARKSVSHFYFGGRLQSGGTIRKFAERWGRSKGWIMYYLICAYNLEKWSDCKK